MSTSVPVVYVIDDDLSFRRSIELLIQSVAYEVKSFCSAEEFLKSPHSDVPSCLILDVRMPGLSGLDLQQKLLEIKLEIPIIFITGHGDIPMSVRAMKAGAMEFLTKPFHEQDLLDAISKAIERNRLSQAENSQVTALRNRYEILTPKERQVMSYVVAGLLNKQIADKMGTSEITVKIHRHQVMEKMEADSLAMLVRISEKLGIPLPKV
ncbi:MAG: response regulator transcription factor [Nitrospiria bacterium]